MPRIFFTDHLLKHRRLIASEVAGATVADALNTVFQQEPELRSYLLDDQGCVRQHVMIFVDDAPLRDRQKLSDPLEETSEIYVMQALSGG